MSSKLMSTLGITAGAIGIAFIGYWIYSNRKPTTDRFLQIQKRIECLKSNELPDIESYEELKLFFENQILLGENYLAKKDSMSVINGIERFCNAIVFANQPNKLMDILREILTRDQFQYLTERLPIVKQKLAELLVNKQMERHPEFDNY